MKIFEPQLPCYRLGMTMPRLTPEAKQLLEQDTHKLIDKMAKLLQEIADHCNDDKQSSQNSLSEEKGNEH